MNWELINKIRRFLRTSWIKSIYFNFTMLPFKQAIHLPIIMTKYAYLYSLSGKIVLKEKPRFAMARIGYLAEDIVAPKEARNLLQIEGIWELYDNVQLGVGTLLRIEKNARFTTENNVRIGAKAKIICYENIYICQNSSITWECQIIDTSFHYIRSIVDQSLSPLTSPIKIGSNSWICNRSSIMKGVELPPNTIVASESLCNKKYDIPEYSLIAGTPAKLVKTGLYRCSFKEENEIKANIAKSKENKKQITEGI